MTGQSRKFSAYFHIGFSTEFIHPSFTFSLCILFVCCVLFVPKVKSHIADHYILMTTNPFLTIVLFMCCAIYCVKWESDRARARTLLLDPFTKPVLLVPHSHAYALASLKYVRCTFSLRKALTSIGHCVINSMFSFSPMYLLKELNTFQMTFLRCSHSYRLLIEMHTRIFGQLFVRVFRYFVAGTKFQAI